MGSLAARREIENKIWKHRPYNIEKPGVLLRCLRWCLNFIFSGTYSLD